MSLVCLVVALLLECTRRQPTGSNEGLLLIEKSLAVLVAGNLLGPWLMAF